MQVTIYLDFVAIWLTTSVLRRGKCVLYYLKHVFQTFRALETQFPDKSWNHINILMSGIPAISLRLFSNHRFIRLVLLVLHVPNGERNFKLTYRPPFLSVEAKIADLSFSAKWYFLCKFWKIRKKFRKKYRGLIFLTCELRSETFFENSFRKFENFYVWIEKRNRISSSDDVISLA